MSKSKRSSSQKIYFLALRKLILVLLISLLQFKFGSAKDLSIPFTLINRFLEGTNGDNADELLNLTIAKFGQVTINDTELDFRIKKSIDWWKLVAEQIQAGIEANCSAEAINKLTGLTRVTNSSDSERAAKLSRLTHLHGQRMAGLCSRSYAESLTELCKSTVKVEHMGNLTKILDDSVLEHLAKEECAKFDSFGKRCDASQVNEETRTAIASRIAESIDELNEKKFEDAFNKLLVRSCDGLKKALEVFAWNAIIMTAYNNEFPELIPNEVRPNLVRYNLCMYISIADKAIFWNRLPKIE